MGILTYENIIRGILYSYGLYIFDPDEKYI